MRRWRQAVLAGLAIGAAAPVMVQAAQEPVYPVRPVRLIVPFPPGGTPDIQGRLLAEHLRESMGQPVVVDNRGGANGVIGMEIAARARPDGYTIIIGTVGNWAVHRHLHRLSYDTLKDFEPVVYVATSPAVLVVSEGSGIKSVKELIALAKEKPGALNYGSAGIGGLGHVSAELFAVMAGVKLTHVPYKSSVTALTEVISGTLQVLFNGAAQTVPHVKAGRVRALATTGAKRAPLLADLPTVAEAGVPGYENSTWSVIGAPAGTPRAIVARLNREFNAALRSPEIEKRFAAAANEITGGTPEECRQFLQQQSDKYGKLVRMANLKGDSSR